MREIITDDLYNVSEILDKLNIEFPSIKDVKGLTRTEIDVLTKQQGIDFVMLIMKKLYKAKKEVNVFIASIMEISEQEASKLKIKELKQIFEQLKNNEDLKSFFSSMDK